MIPQMIWYKDFTGYTGFQLWLRQSQNPNFSWILLITDKTNAADLPSGVFTILISITRIKKYKIHCRFTNFAKSGSGQIWNIQIQYNPI